MIRHPSDTAFPTSRRRGSSLIEMAAAIGLLGAVMAVLLPVLSRTSGLRDEVDRKEVAASAVANLLERASLVASPTPESLQSIADPLTAQSRLDSPQWTIVVTPEPTPPLNRVEATLSWKTRHGTRNSVMLVRWYPGGKP